MIKKGCVVASVRVKGSSNVSAMRVTVGTRSVGDVR